MEHPPGMTVGSMNPETEEEYWICQHCFNGDHERCTGFAVDPELNEPGACECSGKHPNAEPDGGEPMRCQFCSEDISCTAARHSCPNSEVQANAIAAPPGKGGSVDILKTLREALPKLWTDELYSEEFRSSPCPYKDFDHALKHVMKAAVMLQNMVEEADHGAVWDPLPVKKYLADLVICTVRAALKAPGRPVDLERAVLERIELKMGVRLDGGFR